MPGSATIDTAVFADSLIEIVDDIRRDTIEGLGFRQFIVELVTVTPLDRRAGGPAPAPKVIAALDPVPRVRPYKFANMLEPCGLDEAGTVIVDELSLTYTEPELTGKNLEKGQEFYWRISEGQGQETCTRYFTVDQDPFPNRACADKKLSCMSWTVRLRAASEPV